MATSAVSGINQDQFLQLLVSQLQNQDPLDPVSDKDFIAQLTSLNTLQGITSLNANFADMLKLQQLTQGADLIGKKVNYLPPGASTVSTGTVSGVTLQNGSFVLQVGTDTVTLDEIQSLA